MPKGGIEKDAWHRSVGILCELDCHLFIFIERPYFTRTINQQEGFNYRPMTLFTGASMVKWKRPVSGQTRTRLPSTLLPYSRWWKFKCFERRYYLIRIVTKHLNVLKQSIYYPPLLPLVRLSENDRCLIRHEHAFHSRFMFPFSVTKFIRIAI